MEPTGRNSKTRRFYPQRRGAVAVEFASVLAIAFIFFFTAFEFCRVAVMEHNVDNAVYESLRSGMVPGGDATTVAQTARRVLSTIGIDDARITVTPPKIDASTEHITVKIRVPFDSNSLVPTNFFRGKTIERSLTMRREGARPTDQASRPR